MRNILRSRVAAVTIAAVAVVGLGAGGATAANMIESDDVRNNSLQQVDLGRGSVGKSELVDNAVGPRFLSDGLLARIQNNSAQQGEQGEPGLDGEDGVSGYEVKSWDYATVSGGGWADMGCTKDSGKVPTGGGYWWKDEAVAMEKGLSVVTSMPGRMDWSTNTPDPTKPGWIIRPNKPVNVNPGALTVYVICAKVAG
jgi:hypothetical protein